MSADTCDLLCLDLVKGERIRHDQPDAEALSSSRWRQGPGRADAAGDRRRVTGGRRACVCDLGWVVERSEKLVSHHVRALRAAGVVESRREGKMVMYLLTRSGRALLDAAMPIATGSLRERFAAGAPRGSAGTGLRRRSLRGSPAG